MSKMQYNNDDGSVVIPLRKGPDGEARFVVIDEEPSLGQMAKMQVLADDADSSLPMPEALPSRERLAELVSTPEDLVEYVNKIADVQQVLRERQMKQWSETGPYALAFIETVKMLTGQELTVDDVYSWVAHPQALKGLLSWFQAPLPGLPAAEPSPATQ